MRSMYEDWGELKREVQEVFERYKPVLVSGLGVFVAGAITKSSFLFSIGFLMAVTALAFHNTSSGTRKYGIGLALMVLAWLVIGFGPPRVYGQKFFYFVLITVMYPISVAVFIVSLKVTKDAKQNLIDYFDSDRSFESNAVKALILVGALGLIILNLELEISGFNGSPRDFLVLFVMGPMMVGFTILVLSLVSIVVMSFVKDIESRV